MAPIRCPVSCPSTNATWNRHPTCRDTPSSARYSSSVRTTRLGFFSLGFLRPFSGLESRRSLPSSSLALQPFPRSGLSVLFQPSLQG